MWLKSMVNRIISACVLVLSKEVYWHLVAITVRQMDTFQSSFFFSQQNVMRRLRTGDSDDRIALDRPVFNAPWCRDNPLLAIAAAAASAYILAQLLNLVSMHCQWWRVRGIEPADGVVPIRARMPSSSRMTQQTYGSLSLSLSLILPLL